LPRLVATTTDDVAITPLVDGGARVGESPVWRSETSELAWIDMPAGTIHRTTVPSGVTVSLTAPWPLGAVAPRQAGWIATTWQGFAWLGSDGTVERELEVLDSTSRMNDGACDRRGRFFAGSTARDGSADRGALHALDPDGTERTIFTDLALPNGMGWSPRGDVFYLADSLRGHILAFDIDPDTGWPVRRRVLTTFSSDRGLPDGLCIDEDGCLWVAFWDGGGIARVSPEGDLLRWLPLPVSRPTSCVFGGAAADILFVTSALHDAPAQSPLDGAVFTVSGLGTRGTRRYVFTG
jgi:sugar lactone lactonase YvrE